MRYILLSIFPLAHFLYGAKPNLNKLNLEKEKKRIEQQKRQENEKQKTIEQRNTFQKIKNDLTEFLNKTENNFTRSLHDYDVEKVKKYVYIYQQAEESRLIKWLNDHTGQSYPTLQELIKQIINTSNQINQEVGKINFNSYEYQKKSRRKKKECWALLSRKIRFALGAPEKWHNHHQKIKKSMISKMKNQTNIAMEVLEKTTLQVQDCEKMNSFLQTCEILTEFLQEKEFDQAKKNLESYKKKCIDYLHKKVPAITQFAKYFNNPQKLAALLIETSIIQKNIDKIYINNIGIEDIIENTLKNFKKEAGDSPILKLNQLSNLLWQDPAGGQIVAESTIFRGISIMIRNNAFSPISIEGILSKIKEYQAKNDSTDEEKVVPSNIDSACLDKIKKAYEQFKKKYWELIEENLGEQDGSERILSSIKKNYIEENQLPSDIEWMSSKAQIPSILAYLFAYWTLNKVEYYYEAQGVNNEQEHKKYLQQPHPVQIVAIMRILGVGDVNNQLSNHLAQIGTGEGKSVVTFATAVTLALLGFDVSCVCYSPYLSLRDHNQFMPLIRELGMSQYIRYTTFNNLCESIINEKGDIRTQLVKFINTTSANGLQANQNSDSDTDDEKKDDLSDLDDTEPTNHFVPKLSNTIIDSSIFKFSPNRARIIFIDEVDVFFNKDFYGSPYSPTALLQHPAIDELLELIWKNRKDIFYQKIIKSKPYKNCINIFTQWQSIITEAVKRMIADLANFKTPAYTIQHNNLCYKEGDGLNSKINYQYKTAFACLYENKKQKITKENLQKRLGIYLNCGLFSYAEIPATFSRILGVTGTLDSLGSVELSILKKEYKIKLHTYMPSLYGDSKRKFFKNSSKGLKIIQKSYYTGYLKKEIENALQGSLGSANDKRAVIVFFETPQKLDHFFTSPVMDPLKENTIIMKSDLSFEEKRRCIANATIAGNITFSIREFGRGTDFICYDKTVNKNGGIHVIITFFPENISEEKQIVGRTARQGNEGSVSMLLEEERLEGFLSEEEIKHQRTLSNDFYTLLNERRNKAFASKYKEAIKYVKEIKQEHKKAMQFTKDLFSSKVNPVINHLMIYNKAPASNATNTIVLVDATVSMDTLLDKAQKTITSMFQRINDILKNRGKKNAFILQFAAYRNYNASPDKLLQVSPWASRAEQLVIFMNGVKPEYGWSYEAIEIGLAHVLREHSNHPIDQVILIGDMPPNTRDDIDYKRSNSSIKWEEEDPFYQASYYEEYLDKIKEEKIPIHAFHVPPPNSSKSKPETQKAFSQIAKATGGSCELLNIRSEKGAEQLTNIVSQKVLYKVDGKEAVQDYINTYGGKSYL